VEKTGLRNCQATSEESNTAVLALLAASFRDTSRFENPSHRCFETPVVSKRLAPLLRNTGSFENAET
jgi:hypothetical protein